MVCDGDKVPHLPPAPDAERSSTSPAAQRTRRMDRFLVLIMLVLPALFFDWALPFVSDTSVGNDYWTYALPQQLELQFSLKSGSFPLYAPGFAGGRTAQGMMQGQLYHPISLLASHLPGYWSGFALELNTLLRLLSLALAHLALFVFLRRLGSSRAAAFLLSMVTTYNMRMLDLFRYGASLESWTGHLFLCAFVGLYYLRPSSLGARAGIIAATYWLVTSGHPQMAYYGFLTTGLFTLLLPFIAAAMTPQDHVHPTSKARFWLGTAFLLALGLLLSSAFIVPFASEFFAGNARSAAGHNIGWTLAWLDTLPGALSNLFLPLRADVHAAFGGTALVLLAALVPALFLLRVRVPLAVLVAWALAVVIFLALLGDRTPVYLFLWRYFPFFSSMRAPGRLSLFLPVLLMCVLVWLLNQVERPAHGARRFISLLLGGGGLLASAVYLVAQSRLATPASVYSPVTFNQVSSLTLATIAALGLSTLLCFALLVLLPRWRTALLVAMCVSALLETKLVIAKGTWRDVVGKTPTYAQWAGWKRDQLGYRFPSGEGTFDPTMWRQAALFHVEPALARVYFEWRQAHDVEGAYRLLQEGVPPNQLVVEAVGHEVLSPLPPGEQPSAQVRLTYSSFNRLDFSVQSSHHGYFSLAYPYTGRWTAFVDGRAVPIRRANGGHHAVPIPPGHSTIELRYRSPGQLVGWAISGLALVFATFVLLLPAIGRRRALALGLVVAVATAAQCTLLVRSLYAGQNLKTRYAWSGPEPLGPLPNLAYGRRTSMSSMFQIRQLCCPYVGSKGTDGDRSSKSGFMTEEEDAPVWGVDLGQEREIGKVVAFESRHGLGWNARPLGLAFSHDGKTWTPARGAFHEQEGLLVAELVPPVTARFVAIRAGGRCRLSLDEVEVFPPGP